MKRSPHALADPTGSYAANIISKNGRNEVQIYHIDGSPSKIQASVAVKLELSASERPIDAMWLKLSNSNPKTKSLKRKQDVADVDDATLSIQPQLLVLLQSNEIIVMLPTHSTITKRINPEPRIVRLLGLSSSMHIWAIADAPKLVELSLESGLVSRSNKFKEDESIYVGSVASTNRSKQAALALIGSTQIYLADPLKVRAPVLQRDTLPTSNPTEVTCVRMSITRPNTFYVVFENSSQVSVYDMEGETSNSTLEASGDVLNLSVIKIGSEEFVMATTVSGIDTFQIESGKRSGTIKSGSDGCLLTDVFIHEASRSLVGILHDANEPIFELIDCKLPLVGDIQVEATLKTVDSENAANESRQIQLPATCTINNESAGVILNKLARCLSSEVIDPARVVSLCCENDDSATIKETVMLISLFENSKEMVDLLISSISPAVSADAGDITSLPIWLKWLLLLHGGTIAREPNHNDALRELQTGLQKGMVLLPHMLALQGRLNLLKAQAEFREKMASFSLDEESDEQEVSGAQEQPQTIAFANGENDDDDVFEIGDADVDEEIDVELQV